VRYSFLGLKVFIMLTYLNEYFTLKF